ncbi:hypothetical protein MLD38_031873 [Melastoma candidum]|uniref:Uncharacterized protein n=1 Tax=Melastoma candidum TaxID=119954 RepID=A0ACB9MR20_9MYRT|nr:hypothetical protein MLD38_031873 [Melastoma candidum]
MIGNSEEEGIDDIQAKEEGAERTNNEGRVSRTSTLFTNPGTSTSNSSRQWSAFRNPRIVRVSRTFGGKDRHSKVCTIRGLRDRRIRLSVPTAVQLYDLQDKLGLGQPSKVIDWLLDASKEDIDNLPPLQMPQGFGHHHFKPQQMLLPGFHEPGLGFLKDGMLDHSSFLTRRHGININESYVGVDHHEGEANSPHDRAGGSLSYSTHLHLGSLRMTQESSEITGRDSSKGKWVETHEGQSYRGAGDCSHSSQQGQVSAQNFFPIVSYSLGGLPPVNPMVPYGYNTHWEPSSLSLSRYGSHGLQFQTESPQGSNAVTVAAPYTSSPSSSSLSGLAPSQHMYFCPPAATTPLFPPYPQQMGHHQMPSSLSSGFHLMSPPMKPFQGNIGGKYYHREDEDGGEDQDDDEDDEDGD